MVIVIYPLLSFFIAHHNQNNKNDNWIFLFKKKGNKTNALPKCQWLSATSQNPLRLQLSWYWYTKCTNLFRKQQLLMTSCHDTSVCETCKWFIKISYWVQFAAWGYDILNDITSFQFFKILEAFTDVKNNEASYAVVDTFMIDNTPKPW